MDNQQELLKTYSLNGILLKNRMVMAPMTRSRATLDGVVTDSMALYYQQRASAGLIITEGCSIDPMSIGYRFVPGIFTDAQIESWKKVTDAVHKEDCRIFLQLWHVGRISHPDFLNGKLPLAPSAIKPSGRTRTYTEIKEMVTPKEMTVQEINQTIEQFRIAAKNAINAGFDGVEIHGANNYLLQQFLCDGSNIRIDKYGGAVENRARFALEVVDAVASEIRSNFVGIKLSPSNYHYGTTDSNPIHTYDYLVSELNKRALAYLHLQEPFIPKEKLLPIYLSDVTKHFRSIYQGNIIANAGFNQHSGNQIISDGLADLVSFGALFLANPDLPYRFEKNLELNEPLKEFYYDGGDKGYIDYSFANN